MMRSTMMRHHHQPQRLLLRRGFFGLSSKGPFPWTRGSFDRLAEGSPAATTVHSRCQAVTSQKHQQRRSFFFSFGSNPVLEMTQRNLSSPLPDFSRVSPKHLVKAARQVQAEYEQAWAELEVRGSADDEDNLLQDKLWELETPPTILRHVAVLLLQMNVFDTSWIRAVGSVQTVLAHRDAPDIARALRRDVSNSNDDCLLAQRILRQYEKRGVLLEDEEDRKTWEILRSAALQLEASFVTAVVDGNERTLSTKDKLQNLYTLLKVKQKQADMLGYHDYAALAMDGRMMNKEEIVRLQEEVAKRAKAAKEAQDDTAETPVDVSPYLTLDGVLEGLFALCRVLFGIEITEDSNPRGWHPDVRLFHVTTDHDQKHSIGSFYLDPFARPTKSRTVFVGPLTANVVYVNTIVKPPVWDHMPTAMQLQDVVNLFHEFGHVLQFLMAQHRHGLEDDHQILDIIEVVPHFMEHWVFETSVLQTLAHLSSPSPGTAAIPDAVVASIRDHRRRSKIDDSLRRVFLGQLELELFSSSNREEKPSPGGEVGSIVGLQRRLAEQHTPREALPKSDLSPTMQLVEAGGAKPVAQYRYLVSELISADLFEAFTDAGLDNREAVSELGRIFKDTMLSPGRLVDAKAALQALRGRNEVSTEAYFKLYNL